MTWHFILNTRILVSKEAWLNYWQLSSEVLDSVYNCVATLIFILPLHCIIFFIIFFVKLNTYMYVQYTRIALIIPISVWLGNRLISAGFQLVLSLSYHVSYCIIFVYFSHFLAWNFENILKHGRGSFFYCLCFL